jgi:hypothetical protein
LELFTYLRIWYGEYTLFLILFYLVTLRFELRASYLLSRLSYPHEPLHQPKNMVWKRERVSLELDKELWLYVSQAIDFIGSTEFQSVTKFCYLVKRDQVSNQEI